MDADGIVLGGIILLFVLLFAGAPVFLAFLSVSLAGCYVLLGPNSFGVFVNSVYSSTTSGALVTVPMFLLMGEILFRSGSVDVLFKAIDSLIGRLWGRQYFLSIALSTVFGALSGSAVAVAALLGRSLMPAMTAHGYDKGLSAGTILAGASLAPIIPPSILVILVGSLANVSVAKLMIAGIIPGLMIAGLCALYIAVRGLANPALAPRYEDRDEDVSNWPLSKIFINLAPFTALIALVIGLILLGVATPTESGAVGVGGAAALAALYRRLSVSMILNALISAVKLTSMLIIILACSKVLGQLLAFTGATQAMVSSVAALDISYFAFLFLLLLIPFVLCMFLDQVALMLILIPVYAPLTRAVGFDPIWFWTLFLIVLTVGSITPPFGYTLFALRGADNTLSVAEIYKASAPFVAIFVAAIFLFVLIPPIVTYLPGLQ